jgi:hypothetical protein
VQHEEHSMRACQQRERLEAFGDIERCLNGVLGFVGETEGLQAVGFRELQAHNEGFVAGIARVREPTVEMLNRFLTAGQPFGGEPEAALGDRDGDEIAALRGVIACAQAHLLIRSSASRR